MQAIVDRGGKAFGARGAERASFGGAFGADAMDAEGIEFVEDVEEVSRRFHRASPFGQDAHERGRSPCG